MSNSHHSIDIKGLGPQQFSNWCPDLCIRVKSARPKMFIPGIVVEVGFSQSLASLRQKAFDWLGSVWTLQGRKSQIKGKKLKNEWSDWLMRNNNDDRNDGNDGNAHNNGNNDGDGSQDTGGALEEDIIRSMGGRMVETKTEGQEVLMGVTQDLKTWLLEQDEQGVLISTLVESMDATIYVYARAGNDEREKLDGDGRGGGAVAAQPSASDAGCGASEEYPAGHADDFNNGSTSSDNSFDPSKICSDSETENTGLPISFIFSAPLLASSKPIAPSPHSRMNNNPPPTIPTVPSSLLELIPPMIRPHAHHTIAIPLDDPARLVIDASEELREERAMSRVVNMVEREWAKVWEAVIKAREIKQRGERKNERVERLVERRKR
ncbi:hypothetical protein BGX38DRAFT_1334091 [Terfezia claveryi]|nr:hypothetical protein BGX38DRAFT_1334091 [Terfezia claveryi]